MRRHVLVRLLLSLLAICAFAAIDAVIKGHHGGTRNAIGNVSAPWALIPFLSAAFVRPRRLAFGGLVGAGSAIAALACYSLVRPENALAMGSEPRGISSLLVGSLGNRWLLLGALCGAVLGIVGSWLAKKKQWGLVTAVVTSLLVLEPGLRITWAIAKGEGARTMVPSPAVWVVEVLSGCAAGLVFWLRRAFRHDTV
jgi:hypothetical protein